MNRSDLTVLSSRAHSSQRSVLSVYLQVDQSDRRNLNRGYASQLKRMASSARRSLVDASERKRFAAAMHHIEGFVSDYSPTAKALILFFDTSDAFFWHGEVGFAVTDQLRWDRELFLQPLANAMDQIESYGVVLADRAKLRLFTVTFGRIEEKIHEELDARSVRHLKTVGIDHANSSSRMQRRADNQVRMNLRQAAKKMEDLARAEGLHRFVLAGTPEIAAELRKLLPERLASTVIGEVSIAMSAVPGDVLSATLAVAENYERGTEVEKVRKIVTSAAKNGKAVLGLGKTLKAVNSDRVWELVYSGSFQPPGYECLKCSALFSARPTRCPYCSSRTQSVVNVVERAVEHALRRQARIEIVTGEASTALMTAGGIGAFLKTRTGPAEA